MSQYQLNWVSFKRTMSQYQLNWVRSGTIQTFKTNGNDMESQGLGNQPVGKKCCKTCSQWRKSGGTEDRKRLKCQSAPGKCRNDFSMISRKFLISSSEKY